MNTERILELAKQSGGHKCLCVDSITLSLLGENSIERFAELIVRECVDKIETYRIPVGNSAAGEMACEWTYDALKEIRDEIKEHFGVESNEQL
jgi:hypothetical protein